MALQDDFKAAAERIKTISARPNNDELLELYALFKQGSTGDVSGKRPGMLDLKGRAKYDAWAKKTGMSKDAAMKSYVDVVKRLAGA